MSLMNGEGGNSALANSKEEALTLTRTGIDISSCVRKSNEPRSHGLRSSVECEIRRLWIVSGGIPRWYIERKRHFLFCERESIRAPLFEGGVNREVTVSFLRSIMGNVGYESWSGEFYGGKFNGGGTFFFANGDRYEHLCSKKLWTTKS